MGMGKSAVLALKITGDSKDAIRSLDDVEDRSGRFGGTLGKLGAIGAGAAVGIGAAAVGLGKLYEAADESRKIGALTEQVIKSTGGAAQISADQVGNLAAAIANKTGVDDEAIQSGENLLLTFTNIKNQAGAGNDIFDQTTKIMTDMSVALGTDASGSAVQLGKALNDPVKGISALQKVGVSFTADQKEQIKTLVESGDTLGAQKIILNELGREFGGAAEAAATPLGKLQQRLGDVAEKAGGYLLPIVDKAATFLGDRLGPAVSLVADKLGPVLVPILQQVGEFITGQLIPSISSLYEWLAPKLMPIFSSIGDILTGFVIPAFKGIWGIIQDYVVPIFKSVLGPALEGAKAVFDKLRDALVDNKDKFIAIYDKVKPFLEFLRDKVAPFIGSVLKGSFEALSKAIGPVVDTITWILDKAASVIGFFTDVGEFLFGGGGGGASKTLGAAAPVGAVRGASPKFGASPMFGASTPLPGASVGPGAAGQGLALGDTYNITVTGALDPAAVADQIGRLLDDRARRVGAAPAFGMSFA